MREPLAKLCSLRVRARGKQTSARSSSSTRMIAGVKRQEPPRKPSQLVQCA